MDPLTAGDPDSLLNTIRQLQIRIEALERSTISANSADEVFNSIGELEYRAVDESGVTRAIMSALSLLDEFGIDAHFAIFDENQVPQVWMGNGTMSAMGGLWRLDANGQRMSGLQFPLYFQATEGGEERQLWIGLNLPAGETTPVASLLFTGEDSDNLLINGNAEEGDLSGWTDTDSNWQISETAADGAYSFESKGTGLFPGQLKQTASGLTAGYVYQVKFNSMLVYGILSPKLILKWKTSGGSVVRTDTMYGSHGGWSENAGIYTCPATADRVEIIIDPGDPFNIVRIDKILFYKQAIAVELRMTDTTLKAIANGVEYDLLNLFDADAIIDSVNSQTVMVETADFYGDATSNGMGNFNYTGFTAGTATYVARTGDHIGILNFATAGTNNSGFSVRLGSNDMLKLSGGEEWMEIFNLVSASSAFNHRMGFGDVHNGVGAFVDGAWINIANLTLDGRTSNNSASSTTGTSYTLSTGVWYRIHVVVNSDATRVDFYLYNSDTGVLLWSDYLTTNIPTAAGRECCPISLTYRATTGGTIQLDRVKFAIRKTLTR